MTNVFFIISYIARGAARFTHWTFLKCRVWVVCGCSSLLLVAESGGTEAQSIVGLNRFYDHVRTFSARFEQVVLDESLNLIDESSGVMLISRPGRFRWDYEPPNEQEIVSNGDAVWIYDVELEQITLRSVEQALGKTPASLLAGSGDIKTSYAISDLGQAGALAWVAMRPKDEESGFSDVRIGFENGLLRIMEFVDGLGQTTRVSLSDAQENINLGTGRFNFVAPEGIDVIDETQNAEQ